jgi:3-hydroxyacyl-CoA dehydrogenase
MMNKILVVRRAAVLGAGVMGAQIAAHLANAGIETLLFDLPAKEGNRSEIALKAIANLKKQKPSPLAVQDSAELIHAMNYEEHSEALHGCDLVIEAIAERMEWKLDLYKRMTPYLAPHTIFASNTSGLSINALAQGCPSDVRARFCGVHFFNPPRYMPLVELIATKDTDPVLLDQLETFLVTTLGKGVIRAKDTPNFIANRIGVFSLLSVIHNAQKYNIRFDVVDDLTGTRLGRPKSATFRTADVVGLDTFTHVLKTMQDTLPNDPWHEFFATPAWLQACIDQGALGAKTKRGIYKKEGEERYVIDPETHTYVLADQKGSEEVKALLKIEDPAERFQALRSSTHPEAQFLWASFRDTWHYIVYHFADIAESARDIDLAMRWGYGWKLGPLEIWQAAGWQEIASAIQHDIETKQTLADVPLPQWVLSRLSVHSAEGSYSVAADGWIGHSTLPVYQRQLFPPRLVGEGQVIYGKTLYENAGMRMWTMGDNIAVISFKTKLNCIGDSVLQGINEAITLAENNHYRGIVFWQPEGPFSIGADLMSMGPAFMTGDWDTIEAMVALFQQTSMRIKYSTLPIIAATQGYGFGGGCEFIMHCDRVVACLESYIGLVEVGVGLLPAGGGCKEFALRASQESTGDLFAALKEYYMAIATAKVATSAREAQEIGYLRAADIVIFNPYELLYVAKAQVVALSEAGYHPPIKPKGFAVAGRSAAATIRGQLINMREGGFISKYDAFIAEHIADIMTGGEVEAGTLINEEWIIELERKGFMTLLKKGKTQERIMYMLENNKPLRN